MIALREASFIISFSSSDVKLTAGFILRLHIVGVCRLSILKI